MLRSLRLVALAAIAFSVTACGSSDPEEEITEPAPSFSIASVVVPLQSGAQGLQFSAIPNADVQLTRVNITNPRAQQEVFNANNNVFLSGQRIDLQDPNIAYTRVSGNWSFQFIGKRAAGSEATFNVTVPLSVSAVQEEIPEPEIAN